MYVPIKKHLSTALLSGALLSGCASVKPPTGGPKDEKAPVLTESNPANNSTNFKGKVVKLEFDEDVELNNLNTQLLITPYMNNNYTTHIKRNVLTLTFEKELPPNTTISLNFREGIKDIHEATNKTKDLKLAFSTGNSIDSLQWNGQILDFQTQKPQANTLVALYKLSDTLNIRKQAPYYIGRSNDAGQFDIANIAAGEYFACAFDDKNNNYKYDERTESIGFLSENLKIQKNESSEISLFMNDNTAPRFLRTRNVGKSVVFSFSEGLTYIQAAANPNTVFDQSEDKADIRMYPQNVDKLSKDSVEIGFTVRDSSDNQLVVKKRVLFDVNGNVDKTTTLSTKPERNSVITPYQTIEIAYASPITDSSFLQKVTVNPDSAGWKATKARLSGSKNTLIISNLPVFKKDISLIVPPVKLIKGNSTKADTLHYTPAIETNFGIIGGQVTSADKDFILELVSEDFKVVQSVRNAKKFRFTYVPAGKYRLRLIVDKNQNGRWDAGSLDKKTQPEKVVIHKEVINLKANWELEDFKL
ncbi:Ig-like domain-containing protein [Flexibacter flexilis DSM 6793]|uniref:Ig-like domain-containing protein n=1 Tax=Flexibacter flexilis DSM 6793 TaxID=927664 RepID=A0A1I1KW48_9BACT|nr:Ig-like domain-containing protein [Flexibacter flexilis]SFC64502.1 Ig-like domain-containing protein [Flexibacter flexilis DSM 6793]